MISASLIKIDYKKWHCACTVLDPDVGEQIYTVGLYRGKKPKTMSSAGSWLKVIDDNTPQDNCLIFNVTMNE